MTSYSSIIAWRIPWTEEPGRIQSMGSQSQSGLKRLSTHALNSLIGCLVVTFPVVIEEFSFLLLWHCNLEHLACVE